jgi:hypothetical protein
MRALADQYGVKLAVGPDRAFALSDGVAMASYADLLILQVQRVQDEPETVRDFVFPLVAEIRDVASQVQIAVQIGAEGDVISLISLLGSMGDEIDGISILTDHISTDFLEQFLTELRPLQSVTPPASPTLPLAQETPAVQITETGIAAHVITSSVLQPEQSEATPTQSVAVEQASYNEGSEENVWFTRFAPIGLVIVGTLACSLIVTAILYALPLQRTR